MGHYDQRGQKVRNQQNADTINNYFDDKSNKKEEIDFDLINSRSRALEMEWHAGEVFGRADIETQKEWSDAARESRKEYEYHQTRKKKDDD